MTKTTTTGFTAALAVGAAAVALAGAASAQQQDGGQIQYQNPQPYVAYDEGQFGTRYYVDDYSRAPTPYDREVRSDYQLGYRDFYRDLGANPPYFGQAAQPGQGAPVWTYLPPQGRFEDRTAYNYYGPIFEQQRDFGRLAQMDADYGAWRAARLAEIDRAYGAWRQAMAGRMDEAYGRQRAAEAAAIQSVPRFGSPEVVGLHADIPGDQIPWLPGVQ